MFCRTVFWVAAHSALCRSTSLWWKVIRANQKGVVVLPAHARAVLKVFQGHLVDCLCRTRRDLCGALVVRVPQELEDDLGFHRMDPRLVGAVLQGKGGRHPIPVGYGAWDGQSQRAGDAGCEDDTGGLSAGPIPDAPEDVWPQVPGSYIIQRG